MEWTGASPHKSALLNRGAVLVDGAKAVVSSPLSPRSALGPLPICTPPLATAKPVNRDAGGKNEEQEIDKAGDKGGVDAKQAADVLEPFWDMLAALTRGCEAPREFHACSHQRDSSGDSSNRRQQTQQHKVMLALEASVCIIECNAANVGAYCCRACPQRQRQQL